jgi:hypothetical protein
MTTRAYANDAVPFNICTSSKNQQDFPISYDTFPSPHTHTHTRHDKKIELPLKSSLDTAH